MKKKIMSLVVAMALIMVSVLGSLVGIVGVAKTITKSEYPFANYKTVLKYDFTTTGTGTSDFTTKKISKSYAGADADVFKITQAKSGSGVVVQFKNVGSASGCNGIMVDIDNSANNTEITLGFKPFTTSTLSVTADAKYYLISKSGTYEEFDYSGAIKISAKYNGTIVVPFSNFKVGTNALSADAVTGAEIELTNVPVDTDKQLIFDNLSYVGAEREAGEIDEFPYTLENVWDEYEFIDNMGDVTPVGALSASSLTAQEGYLKVNMAAAGTADGFKMSLTSKYAPEYDAAYFKVDTADMASAIKLKAVWSISGNTCVIKNGADYYLRTSDGLMYKKTASSEGVVTIPAGKTVEVAVPYESLVLSGTSTGAGKPAITGLTVTFADAESDSAKNLYFSDFGFVKKTGNGFYIPPVMTGEVVTKNQLIVDMDRETKLVNDGTTGIGAASFSGAESGVDQRDISYEGGRTGIPVSGNPSFKWALSFSKDYQGVSFDIDTTAIPQAINLGLMFTQSTTYGVIGAGKPYFLKNDLDGLYYMYYQTSAGEENACIYLPTNFKGKVIVPFSSLIPADSELAFTSSANMGLTITLKGLNGTDKNRYIWFDNLIQHKTDDNIGDNAYKIPSGVSSIREENKMDSDESPENPMANVYWQYAHATDFINSFTKDGAYSYTGQKLQAIRDIGGDVNLWGAGYGGSWTCTGKNAIMFWIDTTNAPNMTFKPMVFLSRYKENEDGQISMGRYLINSDSKIFLYNESRQKSKLATVSGNRIALSGYKGWIVIPFSQLVPDPGAANGTFEEMSLVRSVGLQFMINGMKNGQYVVFDESRLVLFEAPSEIPTWIPGMGYTGDSNITGDSGSIDGSAATGNAVADTVCVAALIGMTAIGAGFYTKKRKKNVESR